MSQLRVYQANQPKTVLQETSQGEEIANILKSQGVLFERWEAKAPIEAGDNPEKVLAAYSDSISRLKAIGGYTTEDVISLNASHPEKASLRQKFLSEHTHSEDEVRFFVAGRGLFCLHINDKVYNITCEAGDLISVPAGITHWFDMGPEPEFTCIRLFIDPAGWVAQYTGNTIAENMPLFEDEQQG